MRIIETPVYKYDELDDDGKEKAREWYARSVFTEEHDWEPVIEDACDIAELFGLDLRRTRKQRMDKATYWASSIVFSGFASQGDGAAFDGTYCYKAQGLSAVVGHAPEDLELHRIVQALWHAQRKNFYRLEATATTTRGNNMRVEVEDRDDPYRDIGDAADSVRDLLTDYADWIYRRLEAEYEYQMSDESVEEGIRANEYEFTADGEIA